MGIIAALRIAGCRALAQLSMRPDCVLLDGNHNWLTKRRVEDGVDPDAPTLFDLPAQPEPPAVPATVVTRIKADMRCAAVAAARSASPPTPGSDHDVRCCSDAPCVRSAWTWSGAA